jgi:hypothetical protein
MKEMDGGGEVESGFPDPYSLRRISVFQYEDLYAEITTAQKNHNECREI